MYNNNELYEINIDKLAYSLETGKQINVDEYILQKVTYRDVKYAVESFAYTLKGINTRSSEGIKEMGKKLIDGIVYVAKKVINFFKWLYSVTLGKFINFVYKKIILNLLERIRKWKSRGGKKGGDKVEKVSEIVASNIATVIKNEAVQKEEEPTTVEQPKPNIDEAAEKVYKDIENELGEEYAKVAKEMADAMKEMYDNPEYQKIAKDLEAAVEKNDTKAIKNAQDRLNEFCLKFSEKLDVAEEIEKVEEKNPKKEDVGFKLYKIPFGVINKQILLDRLLSKTSLFSYFMTEHIYKESNITNAFGAVKEYIEFIEACKSNDPNAASKVSNKFKESILYNFDEDYRIAFERGAFNDKEDLIKKVFSIYTNGSEFFEKRLVDILEMSNPRDITTSYYYPILEKYNDIIKGTNEDVKEFKNFIKELDHLIKTISGLKKENPPEDLVEMSKNFSTFLSQVSKHSKEIFDERNMILREIARWINAWLVDHNS